MSYCFLRHCCLRHLGQKLGLLLGQIGECLGPKTLQSGDGFIHHNFWLHWYSRQQVRQTCQRIFPGPWSCRCGSCRSGTSLLRVWAVSILHITLPYGTVVGGGYNVVYTCNVHLFSLELSWPSTAPEKQEIVKHRPS